MAKEKLTAKDYLVSASPETEAVDDFVRGRPLVNEGNRLVNGAKRFFERSGKRSWIGSKFRIRAVAGTRSGFDLDAFKAAHPKLFREFYRTDLETTSYEIEELEG